MTVIIFIELNLFFLYLIYVKIKDIKLNYGKRNVIKVLFYDNMIVKNILFKVIHKDIFEPGRCTACDAKSICGVYFHCRTNIDYHYKKRFNFIKYEKM